MTNDPPAAALLQTPRKGRLDSWKEIAAYLRRDVTTVQRWEKRESMPVHRHLHDKLGTVYAFQSELDAWTGSRHSREVPPAVLDHVQELDRPTAEIPPPDPAAYPRPRARGVWWSAATGVVLLFAGAWYYLHERTEYLWRNPLAEARFQHVTDFDGIEQAAAISRDGRFVAFQSDRDGRMDVWVTQVGTGRFHNLTRGRIPELVNASVRTLGFSPDGALVTFWARRRDESGVGRIAVWAIPVLGGDPQPYLEGVAEFGWSADGSRLVYHTTGAGDPMFVRESQAAAHDRPIYTAAAGLHAHFPVWSVDQAFIYFVQGEIPGAMDIWRIKSSGGTPERITHHHTQVTYPVMVDGRTLLYLATDANGSGPWVYAVDVEKRNPHRVSSGLDSYSSLAASADGRRLILTLANPKRTLWRMPLGDAPVHAASGLSVVPTTGPGFAPRLGPGYLLYVSSRDGQDTIWKIVEATSTELWTAPGSRIVGSPDVDTDGGRIAFSVEQQGKTSLFVMNADGTDAHVVTAALDLRGFPAWAPDGRSLASGGIVNGAPHLFRISLDGAFSSLVNDYALDPVWSRDGSFLVYSGPDVGTTLPLKAADADGTPHALPSLVLRRGARRVRFFGDRRALVVMRGDMHHEDLWAIDLESRAERQLTLLAPDFSITDFDVSRDGRQIVLERVQEQSDIILLDTPNR